MKTKGPIGDKLTYPVYRHFVVRIEKLTQFDLLVLFASYEPKLGRSHWKVCAIIDTYEAREEAAQLRAYGFEPERFR